MDLKLTLFRKEKISIGKSNKLKAPIKGLFYDLILIPFVVSSFIPAFILAISVSIL